MPRSNWKGSISFGLVNIPIMLYPAEDPSQKVSFHQLDKRNNARIQYQRINVETGQIVPWEEVIKGYAYSKEVSIPVKEGELKKIAGENGRTIAIEAFVDEKDLDLISLEKTYYIVPDKRGEKGYVILREALKDTHKIGIAKVIISTKEYLSAVVPHDNALVLHLLHYSDEMRPLTEFDIPSKSLKTYKVTHRELEAAKKLVLSMSTKWNPKDYKDEYKLAVERWLKEKIKHLPLTPMKVRIHKGKPGKVIDFVDLLKKSMERDKMKTPHQRRASRR